MILSSRNFIGWLLILIVIAMLTVFRNLLTPLVVALILAIISEPFYRGLKKTLKGNETLSALLIVLAIFLLSIGPALTVLYMVLGELTVSLSDFLALIDSNWVNFQSGGMILPILEAFGIDTKTVIISYVLPALNKIAGSFSSIFVTFFSNLPKTALDFILAFFGLFFFLKDGQKIKKYILSLSPFTVKETDGFSQTLNDLILAIFWGQFLTALAQGFLGGVGFSLFGLPTPVFWGLVMTFCSLIPFVGSAVIYIPTTIYFYISGAPIFSVLLFLAYNLFVVSSVDNLIKPFVIGSRIKIHPAIIFFSLIGGLRYFGVLGILYGPLIAAVFLLLVDIYQENNRQHSLFDHRE